MGQVLPTEAHAQIPTRTQLVHVNKHKPQACASQSKEARVKINKRMTPHTHKRNDFSHESDVFWDRTRWLADVCLASLLACAAFCFIAA
jgi:hypothetical protein